MDRLTAIERFVRTIEAGPFSGAAKQIRAGSRPSARRSCSSKIGSAYDCCCVRRRA
jgi:hypothetical protein